jgi:hypothetical protein
MRRQPQSNPGARRKNVSLNDSQASTQSTKNIRKAVRAPKSPKKSSGTK